MNSLVCVSYVEGEDLAVIEFGLSKLLYIRSSD